MANPDDPVTCIKCNKIFRRRDLKSTITSQTINNCPKCGAVIDYAEFSNSDAWGNPEDDILAIDNWLASVAEPETSGVQIQPIRDLEARGTFLWSIQGLPFQWRCEVVYERAMPHVVEVRLCVDVPPKPISIPLGSEAATEESRLWPDPLNAACARRGVRPDGESGNRKAWWGVAQVLRTVFLPPSLFRPVVDRLNEVIQEVVPK